MNKFIDRICVLLFLWGVGYIISPMIEEETAARKACEEKGGVFITVPHSENYCGVKL